MDLVDPSPTPPESPPAQTAAHGRPDPPRGVIFLLAFAAAAVVGNLYYNQPLLNSLAATFHATATQVAGVTTATQLGYAAGLLFILPLGDSLDRRYLMVLTTLLSAGALLLLTLVRSLAPFLLASFALGAISVTPQLAVPYAATLAPAHRRGRAVGTVMSGLLVGILLSRTVSGFLGARLSWQAVYRLAAVLMLLLGALLWRVLPPQRAPRRAAYGALLWSLPRLWSEHALLRRHALLGAAGFGAFTMFWTTLAFHLHAQPARYGSDVVGAFGLVGLSGALAAQVAGRWAERRPARVVNGVFLTVVVASFAFMAVPSPLLLVTLAVGVVLMDAGVQGSHIANQTRIYSLPTELHSRLNSVYMVSSFLGGALASQVAALAWTHLGWAGVCASAAALAGAGLVVLRLGGAGEPRR